MTDEQRKGKRGSGCKWVEPRSYSVTVSMEPGSPIIHVMSSYNIIGCPSLMV
jgi:hypothetical protein